MISLVFGACNLEFMRVVYLLTYLDSQTGGMERQALQLAKRLRAQGHKIFFITCARLSKMRREQMRFIDRKEGFRVYRVPFFGGARYLNMVFYGIGVLILLALTRRRYQIIHAHQLYTSGLAASFAKLILPSQKVIIKNAAGGDKCGDVAELRRLQGSRFFIALMRRMVDQFIAVSPQTADEMQEIGFTRMELIPNGVDTDYFHPLDKGARDQLRQKMLGAYAEKNVILFVGRLGPEKNLFTLLDAIRLLGLDVHLYLVGDGVLGIRLYQYANEKSIADRVHFWGIRKNVEQWYQIADMFVLPSHSEGSPNTLLEAMSSALPVIGSDIPAIRYIIKDGESGFLFRSEDNQNLAAIMHKILVDAQLRDKLGQQARASIMTRFSLDSVAQNYATLYGSLC